MNCATLFSGFGCADIGFRRAGYTPVWAVEYDADIAAVYRRNHGDHIIVANVCDVDYSVLPRVDLLHASPPCPNFSVAKTGRGETANDRAIADAVIRALETLRPRAFTLENVRGYLTSESFARIRAALDRLDYWSHAAVLNAADFGTPQTRERLWLRAVQGGWMQADRPLSAPVPWVGWYAAIADLIPTLPESQFAPWQLARLPEGLRESVLVSSDNTKEKWGKGFRYDTEPSRTVTTASIPRAFLVDGTGNNRMSSVTVLDADDPSMTITASTQKHPPRAWLAAGRVVAMTPRALARFQGIPDSYWLPDNKALSVKGIGNGVAVEVAEAVARSVHL